MTKMRYLANGLFVGLAALMLSSCFPDNIKVYDGPLQVEFRPTSHTLNLGNETIYAANVQLIGPHQSAPITVNYEVDANASTAVRGEHFDIEGYGATQIPANSSFARIEIAANPDAFTDGNRTVVITLLGGNPGEVIPAHNYKTLTLTLRP